MVHAPGRSRRWVLLAAAIVAVGALVGGGLVLLGGEDASTGEILLEPVSASTRDPFTASVAVDEEPWTHGASTSRLASTTSLAGAGDDVGTVGIAGDEPGLYGGTRDVGSCDPERLVAFLVGTPDKAAAWATVLGITPEVIAAYVGDLTPVVLTADTRVTNHGFRDGEATPLQAVLQAGTAVMVDRYGIPRVKCGCGNPLVPPKAAEDLEYEGDAWPDFEPAQVVHVVGGDELDVLVLVDAAGGATFLRPAGSVGELDGDLEGDGEGAGDGDGGTLACAGTGDGATLPERASLVSEAPGDLDGDGADDRVVAYVIGEEGLSEWHLRVVTASGFGSDLLLDVPYDEVAPVRPLGASDIGGGAETAFVRLGAGASTTSVGLFALVDCTLVWVENAAGGGPPTSFGVGATVTHALGLECRDADADGAIDLVVRSATSTDGNVYATQDVALRREGPRLDGAGTGGWVEVGQQGGEDVAMRAYATISCVGVDLVTAEDDSNGGGDDGDGSEEAGLCGSPEEVVDRLVAARAADDRSLAALCAFDPVVDFVFTLSADWVASAGAPVCRPAAEVGLSGFSEGADACTVPHLSTLIIERAPDAPAVVATRVVVSGSGP